MAEPTPSPVEAAIHHPVRRRLLRALLTCNVLTLRQLMTASRLTSAAALYHLGILAGIDAVTYSRPRPGGAATYAANLDVLPDWARKRIEAGE